MKSVNYNLKQPNKLIPNWNKVPCFQKFCLPKKRLTSPLLWTISPQKGLKWLTPHRLPKPAAPQESLAMVNNDADLSSDDSRASEDCGDLQGDLYIGFFGDEIFVKNNNTPRIGFQNVGTFLPCLVN